jgi:hypothetical protein
MAKTIAQIKKEFPVYENIPDIELAGKIYDKFYKGKLDEESYYAQVFPDIAQKKFEEAEEIIVSPEDMMLGRTGEDYISYKPTTKDIAEISGVSINDPATSKARFGASLGYNQEQKALAIKQTLSKLYGQDIDVRIGPSTGEMEYYNPKTKSYALVDKPGIDLGDFADIGGDAIVIVPDIAATIIGGVYTGGAGAVASGAIAAAAGEYARLKLGQKLYGINKDMTDKQLWDSMVKTGAISGVAGTGGLVAARVIKGVNNLIKGRLVTEDAAKVLDDPNVINADKVALQINEKLDQAKMGSKLKYTLGEALNDTDMLAAQSQFENVKRLGRMEEFRLFGKDQATALNDYFSIIKGINKPQSAFDTGKMIQDVVVQQNKPIVQNLLKKQANQEEVLTEAIFRLPSGSSRTAGVEVQTIAEKLGKTYKQNIDAAAKKLDAAAGTKLINTDEIAKAIAKLNNKEKASLINVAKLENIFKPGVFEQLQESGGKVLIGDVRETMSVIASQIRDKQTGSVTGEAVDVGTLKFLNKAFKKQLKKDAGEGYLNELENFNNLVIKNKELLNNEVISKITEITPQGSLRIGGEEVFEQTFKTGAAGARKAQAVYEVIKNSPDALNAYKEAIYNLYKKEVIENNIPNITKHKNFLKKYELPLKVFFNNKDIAKIKNIGGLKKILDTTTKEVEEIKKKLDKSFSGRLESASTGEILNKIYKPNKIGEIRELKNILKNNPEVWKAFQRSVLTDLNEKVMVQNPSLRMKTINPTAFDNYLNGAGGEAGYKQALKEIFDLEYVKNLELLNSALSISARGVAARGTDGVWGSVFSDIIRARIGQFGPLGRTLTAIRRIWKKASDRVLANAMLNPASLKELVELRKLKPNTERAAVILSKLGGHVFIRD